MCKIRLSMKMTLGKDKYEGAEISILTISYSCF